MIGDRVKIHVRDGAAEDVDAVFLLMRGLAEHEGLLSYLTLTSESLRRFCFEAPKRVELLVAELESTIVGYATLLVQFSPWAAREYLFLDDLYVSDTVRGRGAGSLLMREVGRIAVERGMDVRWHVEKENASAQKFYRSLGAVCREKFIAYWPVETIRAQLERR